jgi:hypothetical protein
MAGEKGRAFSRQWKISENSVDAYWNSLRLLISENIQSNPISFSCPSVDSSSNPDDVHEIIEVDEAICLRVWTDKNSHFYCQWIVGFFHRKSKRVILRKVRCAVFDC